MTTLRQLFAFSGASYQTTTAARATRRDSPELPEGALAAADDEGAGCGSQSVQDDDCATLLRKRSRCGSSSANIDPTACPLAHVTSRLSVAPVATTKRLAVAPRQRHNMAKPTRELIARALARVWSNMLEQSRGSTVGRGIIFDADEWRTTVNEYLRDDAAQGFVTPTCGTASLTEDKDNSGHGCSLHDDARWLLADDEDRWVRPFALLSTPLYTSSPQRCTVRSHSFSSSEQAVAGLLLHLSASHSVCDASALLLALCLLRRLLLRHAVSPPLPVGVEGGADEPSPSCEVFRWYRRHELRVLMAFVGVAVKVHSDYYITCAFLVAMLPRAVTRPLEEPQAQQQHKPGTGCTVHEGRHHRTAAAQQRKPSPKVRPTLGRPTSTAAPVCTPAFSDAEMAWWERWILGPRGLQYHLRVTGEEALHVLGLYASPEDAALLRNFVQSQSFHTW